MRSVKRLSASALAVAIALAATPARAHAEALDPRSTEASLRHEFDAMEQRLLRSGARNTDSTLNERIRAIGCAVAGDACDELRFYVLETSEFNAAMAPNGMMLINSGLLLRLESEAELAFVMAHEYAHYAEGHMIERIERTRSAMAGGALLTIGLGIVGAGALAGLGYLPAAANVTAFSRDQEREADLFAAEFLNTHELDTAAAARAWENLRDEVAASSNETTRRRFTQDSLFATHPLTEERIAYLREVAQAPPSTEANPEAYRALIRPHIGSWLQAEIADRDPGATLHLIARLAAAQADMGQLEYARGEVYRYRNQEGDDRQALASYSAAVGFGDAPVQAWRELGSLQHKLDDDAAAMASFARYLELAPEAPDRALVEMMMGSMGVQP